MQICIRTGLFMEALEREGEIGAGVSKMGVRAAEVGGRR